MIDLQVKQGEKLSSTQDDVWMKANHLPECTKSLSRLLFYFR